MNGVSGYNVGVTATDGVEMDKMTSFIPSELSARGGRTGPIPSGAVGQPADA